ncbi:MAG TPA: hypothetical protein VFA18_24130 [Gemmataceae bacterium]|nr:hypothetical protein [Gemmataceae bacterium]
MRRAYLLLLAGTLVGGCVNMPAGWPGGAKQSAAVSKAAPSPSVKPVRAEDVSDENAHGMAQALRREMDREEADSVQAAAPAK